jgi:putative ABC transport system permease protein
MVRCGTVERGADRWASRRPTRRSGTGIPWRAGSSTSWTRKGSTDGCVLGHRLKARPVRNDDAVGQNILIAGRSFRVVGIGKKLGNTFFDDDEFTEEMEGLYVPLSTLRKFYTGEDQPLSYIAVKTNEVERLGDLKAEVTSSLTIAHRGAKDFRVENIAEEILRSRSEIGTVLTSWRIVLSSIAGISLLVGGIGLLSVLLISIGERVYEIGLRKAIGATDAEIFVQFLIESIVLSMLGGLIGIGLGIGVISMVPSKFPFGLPIQLPGLLFSIFIALALGVVYGIYPALRASRMEPVEALRSTA